MLLSSVLLSFYLQRCLLPPQSRVVLLSSYRRRERAIYEADHCTSSAASSDSSASNRSFRSDSDGDARDAVREGFTHSETASRTMRGFELSLLTSFADDVRLWRDCRTIR
jgi:hypothetical protein